MQNSPEISENAWQTKAGELAVCLESQKLRAWLGTRTFKVKPGQLAYLIRYAQRDAPAQLSALLVPGEYTVNDLGDFARAVNAMSSPVRSLAIIVRTDPQRLWLTPSSLLTSDDRLLDMQVEVDVSALPSDVHDPRFWLALVNTVPNLGGVLSVQHVTDLIDGEVRTEAAAFVGRQTAESLLKHQVDWLSWATEFNDRLRARLAHHGIVAVLASVHFAESPDDDRDAHKRWIAAFNRRQEREELEKTVKSRGTDTYRKAGSTVWRGAVAAVLVVALAGLGVWFAQRTPPALTPSVDATSREDAHISPPDVVTPSQESARGGDQFDRMELVRGLRNLLGNSLARLTQDYFPKQGATVFVPRVLDDSSQGSVFAETVRSVLQAELSKFGYHPSPTAVSTSEYTLTGRVLLQPGGGADLRLIARKQVAPLRWREIGTSVISIDESKSISYAMSRSYPVVCAESDSLHVCDLTAGTSEPACVRSARMRADVAITEKAGLTQIRDKKYLQHGDADIHQDTYVFGRIDLSNNEDMAPAQLNASGGARIQRCAVKTTT